MAKTKRIETRGRKALYDEAMVTITVPIPEDMRDDIDALIREMSPPPSRAALVRAWLAERLQAEGVKS